MKSIKKALLSASAAAGLAAIAVPAAAQSTSTTSASEDSTAVDRVIVFGDSLSDGGFFAATGALPPGAGSFTTNPDPVAPEVFASQFGLTLDPVYGKGGTNYAIGGARVTQPNGITIPIANQVGNFLATDSFRAGDVVYIQGGGNDYFAFLAGGGVNPAILTSSADALAAQVARLEAAGAPTIVTMAVQSGGAAPLQAYNARFESQLAAQGSNVLYFDTDMLFNELVSQAASFGITNVTGVACTVPSSVACTRGTLVSPNANNTYILADSVHPAGISQRVQGQAIASLLKAPEQIGILALSQQATLRRQRASFENEQRNGLGQQGIALFGGIGYGYFDRDGSASRIGGSERAITGTLGADIALGDQLGLGIVGGYSDGDGRFDAGRGTFDSESWSASGYARAAVGPAKLIADVTYGEGDIDTVRNVTLGPALRSQAGATDSKMFAVSGAVRLDLINGPLVQIGPEAGIAYEDIDIDGFTEGNMMSTQATFGDQELNSLTGRFGLVASGSMMGGTGFFARASYVHEFDDDPRSFSITPAGAPVSYSGNLGGLERDYASVAMGVNGRVGPVGLRASAGGEFGRGDLDALSASAGLYLPF